MWASFKGKGYFEFSNKSILARALGKEGISSWFYLPIPQKHCVTNTSFVVSVSKVVTVRQLFCVKGDFLTILSTLLNESKNVAWFQMQSKQENEFQSCWLH